jgi:hypothetical protein
MAEKIKKVQAIKEFFSTEEKPVSNKELMDLVRTDKAGYDFLAEGAAKALGKELEG